MGSFSWWHWLIVLLVVLLLFGGGKKIPELFKGLGTGIKGFKKALKEDDEDELDSSKSAQNTLSHNAPQPITNSQQVAQPQVVQIEVSTQAPQSTNAIQEVQEEAQAPKKRVRAKKDSSGQETQTSKTTKKQAAKSKAEKTKSEKTKVEKTDKKKKDKK